MTIEVFCQSLRITKCKARSLVRRDRIRVWPGGDGPAFINSLFEGHSVEDIVSAQKCTVEQAQRAVKETLEEIKRTYIEELNSKYGAVYTVSDVSREVGDSTMTVHNVLRTMQDEESQILVSYLDGLACSSIAIQHGVSREIMRCSILVLLGDFIQNYPRIKESYTAWNKTVGSDTLESEASQFDITVEELEMVLQAAWRKGLLMQPEVYVYKAWTSGMDAFTAARYANVSLVELKDKLDLAKKVIAKGVKAPYTFAGGIAKLDLS